MSDTSNTPDYEGLVRFLMAPLLDDPSTLAIDCEVTRGGSRVRLRVSFDSEERGRVFGRGGRTIQAVRQVMTAAAKRADQSLSLDVV
ncbi:MAG: KH domain-containing protein [Cyanobacteria bacterium J06648_11]